MKAKRRSGRALAGAASRLLFVAAIVHGGGLAQAAPGCLSPEDRQALPPGSQAAPAAGPEAAHAPQVLAAIAVEHVVAPGESLAAVGARYGIAARLVADQNGLGARAWLQPGQRLSVTARHVLPQRLEDGIVVNLPQRMLYRFRGGRLVDHFPVAVGRPGWPTPVGDFVVVNRQVDKTWYVPRSIQDEMRREGKRVLTEVPPGPQNPLGRHWVGLSLPGIGIHGTIAPASVYGFRSHGCIRMHPDDVEKLFDSVTVGERGKLVYEPLLIARDPDGRIWFEANPDPYRRGPGTLDSVRAMGRARGIDEARVDWDAVARMLRDRDGQARSVEN